MTTTLPTPLLAALLAALAAQDPAPPPPAPAQGTPPSAGSTPEEQLAEKRRLALLQEEQDYFKRCDRNSNGWISLSEGKDSLGLDRTTFTSYDADNDGRVTPEEFGVRYRLSVSRVGAFKPPEAAGPTVRAPTRNAEQLRNAYDRNLDGGISAPEMKVLLADYGRSELPPELAVEKLDRDGSTRLDGGELELLARLLSTSASPAAADPNAPKPKQTLEELFGGLRDRSSGFQAAPMPPQIDGPVPHFRRLDLDDSGAISLEDLRRLQAPLEVPVRAAAVVAALDVDGDGQLSPQEFAAALGR